MNKHLEKLQEKGYRLTRKRAEILEALKEGVSLNVEEIMEKVNRQCAVNLSTVYRNINILLQMGLVRKVNSLEQADQYELVLHKCKHMVECVHCGATVIFTECIFDQMTKEIETKTQYKVNQHHIEVYGTCPKCLKTSAKG